MCAMNLRWVSILSLLPATTQLSLRDIDDDTDADSSPTSRPIYDFGGIFEFVGPSAADSHHRDAADAGDDDSAENWPAGSWKAPLGPDDTYPQQQNFPLSDTRQCSEQDMETLNFWALKQAKKTLPEEGRRGDFKTGSCMKSWSTTWWMGVSEWAQCYQEFYNVSTPCATCIGSVYNMAKYNWSSNCYNLCKGRPHRRDGSHWCWEDCQQCMWYVGKKLSDCYGEPYDMTCRYGKELGKEGYFEKNGIDPKR
mmetsp:Transcript_39916/g.105852  ORF Transcript_39916/g.105852 Transcript_39916/m.105852 type:complete len:252 (+) Transcript_39916:76-831(+)